MSHSEKMPARIVVARTAAHHALGWLVAANLVGLILAALLLWPGLNDLLTPLTLGRWLPLHLDWQLYGWCALPLVAALFDWCLDSRHPHAATHAHLALASWSLALACGGLAWLGGVTSGKMFLEWHGWARPLLPTAMMTLWTLLAAHVWWRREQTDRRVQVGKILVLAALIVVPGALYLSAGREFYPSVNFDSGGATGARLLASTLGIVAIYGFLAEILGIARPAARKWYWVYLVFSATVCVGIEHGHASHHEPAQVLGLATLLIWLPLVWIYFGGETGRSEAKRWWGAAFVWWAILVASGFWTFLPGISERMKFTNGMVGHAHLAMAGLITSANMAVFVELRAVNARRGFWLWQIACAVHVTGLIVLGWNETGHIADLFFAAPWTQAVYVIRLLAGGAMLLASAWWWRDIAGENATK